MRRIVPMLCAALAACSAGDASVGPAVAAGERHVGPAVAAPASNGRVSATPASLTEGAVISLDDLSTEPVLALEPSLGGEPVGESPARDRSFSAAAPGPLPPAIAATLGADSLGLDGAPAYDLSIASTPEAGEWIALVFGGTSVVDAEPLAQGVDEPVPEAFPAAPMQSLR